MRFGRLKFGSIQIDGVTYEYDVVIDGGSIRKRKKKSLVRYRFLDPLRRMRRRNSIPGHDIFSGIT